MPDRVVIAGAGLGGLLCGRLLERRGFSVVLLEQGAQAGGALQSFVRDGVRFDTGFHSVGGLGPGESLERIFSPLGLLSLPWERVEPDEGFPFFRLNNPSFQEERQHVLEPFGESVWRLRGGGKVLADALSEGQDIRLRHKVVSISEGRVRCAGGQVFEADYVVSDLHPRLTFRLVPDPVRPAYRERLERLPDGPGAFTVNAKLRSGALKYFSHSIFVDGQLMLHCGEPDASGFARSIDLLAFEEPAGAAGSGSSAGREARAASLIALAETRLPGLSAAIERYWTSTPATWERFTGTPGGSAFGVRKSSPLDYISPVTPLPWLFLTGQNIGLHGVLGTAVSALHTCQCIKP